ncbi:myo-inositol-1(or 4)-monophosphatase [Nannocystis exedens]|uniref:Inositol-1-monophosphatase n=1 Tax=Nannocystis exedens TaxID=54 RepID=A0A1I2HE45_9BACT|nr:inositol monophosphatase family protein [Nannocystis exedens]PCC70067.1 inositol monophosphatase [Nannocystis exedens]SFF26821.1 myo-inositol-1(or 4)-monophosphatase [Nannocystis exedens]
MHDPELALATAAAHAAGAVLLRHFEGVFEVETKSSPIDLVTSADRAAEAVVLEALRSVHPDHSFLAEESGLSGHDPKNTVLPGPGEQRWVIDPLDGTTNFAHGFPHFCVSIALCDQHGARLGVIHDPIRGETFTAVRGQGARLDRNARPGRALAVSQAGRLQQALIATGFSYQRATTRDDNLAEFCRVVPQVCCVRRAGSAALDLAYVAAGRLDGYWEYHLQPWDVAAGALLIREAGGQICRLDGAPWQLGCADVVAAGPTLLPVLLAELRAAKIEAP